MEYATPSGLPVLENCDIIVYDDSAIHRYDDG